MSKPVKIFVAGDVRGNFAKLFAKIADVQKKNGPFDMLFCVGDFFGSADDAEWRRIVSGEIKVPVATFVLGPNHVEHKKYYTDLSGCELHESITYLGRHGVYTTASGLSVAYLSGVDASSPGRTVADPQTQFSAANVDALALPLKSDSKFKGVDILLTSQWPQGVDKYGIKLPENAGRGGGSISGSALISQLALALKPRYHFASMEGVAYERLPYRNHQILQGEPRHVTRFIALGDVGGSKKQKFLGAYNVVPLKLMEAAELTKQPEDATESPYRLDRTLFTTSAAASAKESGAAQYFYDSKVLERGTTRGGAHNKRARNDFGDGMHNKRPALEQSACWFCLSSPEVEKHLVFSVGSHCYLALPKGGLTADHVLITPIVHCQSTTAAPQDVISEIEQYKSALKKYFATRGLATVFFERNFKTQHLQIQVVAVPEDVSSKLKDTFEAVGLSKNVELAELPKHSDLQQIVPGGAPYFCVELPDSTKLFCRIKDRGFPLQFGREALADKSILNMPDRVDWRACSSSKEEETKMASAIKAGFKKFDFTL